MAIDLFTILVAQGTAAGVTNLLDVPLNKPAVGDVFARIIDFETKSFTTSDLKSIQNALWNDFDTAIRTLNNLQSQLSIVGPRTKSLLASSMASHDPEAFPIRFECGEEPYCVVGSPGVPPFFRDSESQPAAKIAFLDAAKQWPSRLALAFANEAAAIIIQAAIERRPGGPTAPTPGPGGGGGPGDVTYPSPGTPGSPSGPGAPPSLPPGGGFTPEGPPPIDRPPTPPGARKGGALAIGLALGGAVAAFLLLKRK